MCRKKKIRCRPTAEGCAQCTRYKIACHFTPISTKKQTRRPAGFVSQFLLLRILVLLTRLSFRHIAELQQRLTRAEGLLENELNKKSSQKSRRDEQSPFGALDLTTGKYLQGENVRSPLMMMPALTQPEVSTTGHNYVEGIPHLFPTLGDTNSSASIAPICHHPPPSANASLGPFSLPSFHELPPKLVALELVEDAFRFSNSFFPIFNKEEFLRQFYENYSSSRPSDISWWACINVVLCLAYRFRAMFKPDPSYDNTQACGYIHNALAVVSGLNGLQHSLPAVQALVGMALILQGTPNPHVASVLIAAAIRLAQSMGLNRNIQGPRLTPAQREQRKRVFWIAYCLDKDISMRTGMPFSQDDDEMDTGLPEDSTCDLALCNRSDYAINFFNFRIGLAVIQGQIYKRLYSVQGSQRPTPLKELDAQELDSILAYWKSSVPMDFDDERIISFQSYLPTEFIQILILRFTYVYCLAMVNRHLPPAEYFSVNTALGVQRAPIPSESTCVIESRKAIRLLPMTPHGDYGCVW